MNNSGKSAQVAACLEMLSELSQKRSLNETARKELFIYYLTRMFPDSDDQRKLSGLARGAETFVTTAPTDQSAATRGFIDTKNGRLIIEFKSDLTSARARSDADLELKRYVAALWSEKGTLSSYCCITTDVSRWCIWRPTPNAIPNNGVFTSAMVALELIEELNASEASTTSASHLLFLLHRILIEENLLELTPESLQSAFGLESTRLRIILDQLKAIINEARATSEVRLATDLWDQYLAYNGQQSRVFDIDLFAKQLYLVVLSRLIVAASFQSGQTVKLNDDLVKDIINGRFFQHQGSRLANFVERDFFGWISCEPWLSKLLPMARELYHTLLSYDFSSARHDNVFRLIYDEMLPASQRELLGQRSTPTNLISAVIDNVFEGASLPIRFLDPACGCGGFVQAALAKIRSMMNFKLTDQKAVRDLISSVAGIDIDPIALILAKAAWAVSMFDVIQMATEPVDIPIYHADSLFIAQDSLAKQGRKNVDVVFDSCTIKVPSEVLDNTVIFDKFIQWCHQKAQSIADQPVAVGPITTPSKGTGTGFDKDAFVANLANILGNDIPAKLKERSSELAQAADGLSREISDRIRQKRNGIWAFVIRNSYRPSLLTGRFNIIATNPPWLALSSLPNASYKDQLVARAKTFDIYPEGSAFLHLEIATTFALHCVSHFLTDTGSAAFVLPRSIFNGDQHHNFRAANYLLRVPFEINEVWDFEDVPNLFKIPSCAVFATKATDSSALTDGPYAAQRFASLQPLTSTSAQIHLRDDFAGKSSWDYQAGSKQDIAHNYYDRFFRQGADLMPRTALFVEIAGSNTRAKVLAIRTSSIEVNNRNGKVLKGKQFIGSINRQYLYYTVTSNVLLPFLILADCLPLVCLPVQFVNDQASILTRDELINVGDAITAEWFEEVDKALGIGEKTIRERIDVRNKLTHQRLPHKQYQVHVGASGANPCAAIHHNPQDNFVADQTTYLAEFDNGTEAYYLVGCLNSSPLGDIISPYQSKGDFDKRHIHKLAVAAVPPFDANDRLHNQIAELAQSLERQASKIKDPKIRDMSKRIQDRRPVVDRVIADDMEQLNDLCAQLWR